MWLCQHSIVWPLHVHVVPISPVEGMRGRAAAASTMVKFTQKSALPLMAKGINSCSLLIQSREFKYPQASIGCLETGRKCRTQDAVEQEE